MSASTAPRIHHFATTGEAYDDSQTRDDIRHGDVLVVTREHVVAVLDRAWPVAVTEEAGHLHRIAEGSTWADAIGALKGDERTALAAGQQLARVTALELEAAGWPTPAPLPPAEVLELERLSLADLAGTPEDRIPRTDRARRVHVAGTAVVVETSDGERDGTVLSWQMTNEFGDVIYTVTLDDPAGLVVVAADRIRGAVTEPPAGA